MINLLLNNSRYHLVILFIVLFANIFLLLGRLYKTGSAIGGDAVYYYINLRSIVIDKDLNFQDEFEYFYNQRSLFTGNRKLPFILPRNSQTGRLPAKYPLGNAIFLIPPYFSTHMILIFLQKGGADVTTNGYNLYYQASSAIASLLYAFFGLLLIYRLGKKIFEPKIAFLGTLAIWLATPLIYYMTMEPLNSQPISFFCISAFIYLWYTTRHKRKLYQWVILGIIGGLMSIVRYQDLLFLLIPVVDDLKRFSSAFVKIFLFLFIAGSVITIQLSVNNYLFGSPFRTGEGDAGFPYLMSPKILYTLFSLERGLLVWSPIVGFALIGLYWFTKRFKFIGSLFILSFLAQVYVVSSWAGPSQGDSFGNRILINLNIIFALGLMQFLKNTQVYQKLFLGLFSLLILLNAFLAYLFTFRIIGQPY